MNAIYVWDITIVENESTFNDLKTWYQAWCKKWVFQKEKGNSGYIHWQVRVSLVKKKRLNEILKLVHETFPTAHISITSNMSKSDFSYVMKIDTRVEGPYKDNDVDIPSHLKDEIEWYPWQQGVIEFLKKPEPRIIDVVIDEIGDNGKTTLTMWLAVRGLARRVPQQEKAKDIMRCVMDMPTSTCYFFDVPRANSHTKLKETYAAIEEIKNGHLWDDRYAWKEKYIEIPNIWVFTNQRPPLDLLSIGRWRFWKIDPNDKRFIRIFL